jgi:hypothetical protein
MEPSIDQLKKNYEGFDNNKLIRLATEEASSLRPEALIVLKAVIKEKGLSDDVLRGIDVQLNGVSEKALLDYAELLRKQPCPVCNATTEKLNATLAATVMSFIIMTNYKKELKIACPTCLDKQNNKAMLTSGLLGWWGIPWGIVRTVQALILNNKMKKQNHLQDPNDLFKAFVYKRVGRIEANRNKPESLQEMIIYPR